MDWQPIETAPHRTPVLLFCPEVEFSHTQIEGLPNIIVGIFDWSDLWGKERSGTWRSSIGNIETYGDGGACFEHQQLYPTHWMPLPDPPCDP